MIRKIMVLATVILIISSLTITPAIAKTPGDRLEQIDDRVWALNANNEFREVIAKNMLEQGVDFIIIQIMHGNKEKAAYYLQHDHLVIISDSEPEIPEESSVWILKPTIKQTERGLEIFESEKLTVEVVLKALFLCLIVETEGFPDIDTLINNSSWIEEYLPDWVSNMFD